MRISDKRIPPIFGNTSNIPGLLRREGKYMAGIEQQDPKMIEAPVD